MPITLSDTETAALVAAGGNPSSPIDCSFWRFAVECAAALAHVNRGSARNIYLSTGAGQVLTQLQTAVQRLRDHVATGETLVALQQLANSVTIAVNAAAPELARLRRIPSLDDIASASYKTPAEVYAELHLLLACQEYASVEIWEGDADPRVQAIRATSRNRVGDGSMAHLSNLSLAVKTRPVVVRHGSRNYEFGAFFLVMPVSVTRTATVPIMALAETPVQANGHNLPHPHVGSSGFTCTGEGNAAIVNSIRQARFVDAFLVLNTVLQNYGGSPYANIETWNQAAVRATCPECDGAVVLRGAGTAERPETEQTVGSVIGDRQVHDRCSRTVFGSPLRVRLSRLGVCRVCTTVLDRSLLNDGGWCSFCVSDDTEERIAAADGLFRCPCCATTGSVTNRVQLGIWAACTACVTRPDDAGGHVINAPRSRFHDRRIAAPTQGWRPLHEPAARVPCSSCQTPQIQSALRPCRMNPALTVCAHCDPDEAGISRLSSPETFATLYRDVLLNHVDELAFPWISMPQHQAEHLYRIIAVMTDGSMTDIEPVNPYCTLVTKQQFWREALNRVGLPDLDLFTFTPEQAESHDRNTTVALGFTDAAGSPAQPGDPVGAAPAPAPVGAAQSPITAPPGGTIRRIPELSVHDAHVAVTPAPVPAAAAPAPARGFLDG